MNKFRFIILLSAISFLTACSVKTQVKHQYKLEAFNSRQVKAKHPPISILISQPEAVAGYQTEQMMYISKPFELNAFVRNAWVGSPANMLFPLIIQSLQDTGFFYAVSSTPYADKADYRLDTQLIALQQNFLEKPSFIELVVKVVLTHIEDNRVVASNIIGQHVACPQDTPYGGVIAANQATKAFTEMLSDFIIRKLAAIPAPLCELTSKGCLTNGFRKP